MGEREGGWFFGLGFSFLFQHWAIPWILNLDILSDDDYNDDDDYDKENNNSNGQANHNKDNHNIDDHNIDTNLVVVVMVLLSTNFKMFSGLLYPGLLKWLSQG